MMHRIKKYFIGFVVTCFLSAGGLGFVTAFADGSVDSHSKTHKISQTTDIRLTPDKSEIVRLESDAASVIVTNPEHAVVQLESPRLLLVMPRQPGTTAFTVLDKNGKVVMQRNIIVSAAQPRYVRVRRVCGQQDQNCVPSAYYYCPDGCYEVNPVAGDGATPEAPVIQGNAPVINAQTPQEIPTEQPADPSTINITDDDVSPEEIPNEVFE